jgi:hypothetical protein
MVSTLAAKAADALAVLREAHQSGQSFPLVLTDFQMPDMDGFALAAAIKHDPTIAGTNLSKPVRGDTLVELVERHLDAAPVRASPATRPLPRKPSSSTGSFSPESRSSTNRSRLKHSERRSGKCSTVSAAHRR